MAKRNFALMSLILLGGISGGLRANSQTLAFDDGCAALNDIIRQSLVAAVISEYAYPGDNFGPDYGGAQSCTNTTAAVTSAFSASLNDMNIITRWNALQPVTGVACTGYDLRACNPFPDPLGPSLKSGDLAFVHNSWQRVRNIVIAHMPWGVASNMSYFNPRELASSLRATRVGPLQFETGSIGALY